MRFALVFFTLVLLMNNGFAQDCPATGVTFTNQQEIDAFVKEYPNCEKLYSLILDGPGIESLEKLTFLKGITGWLTIRNTSLVDLKGLESVKRIGSTLDIQDNAKLESISHLEITSAIYFDLVVINNPMLQSLEGLEETIFTAVRPGSPVYSSITILDNPQLNSCNLENTCAFLKDYNARYLIADNGKECQFRENFLEQCGAYSKPLNGDLVLAEGFEELDSEATPENWYNVYDEGPTGPNLAQVAALVEGNSALWLSSNIPHFEGHWDAFVWGRFPSIYEEVDIVLTLKCTGVGFCTISLGQTTDNTGYNLRKVWNRPAGDEGVYTVYLNDIKVNDPFNGFGAIHVAATPVITGLGTYGISEFTIDDLQVYANGELVNIAEVDNSNVRLFPNPVMDWLQIEISEAKTFSSIELLDRNGTLLMKQDFAQQVDVSNLPNGFYIIQFSGAEEVLRHTFVKI